MYKYKIHCLTILLSFPLFLRAQISSTLAVSNAVETSNLDWSIAGNIQGESPNILSELKFKNVMAIGAQFNAGVKIKKVDLECIFGSYGTIKGSGTDIDYLEDNRKEEIYKLDFVSKKGNSKLFEIKMMYEIYNKNRINFSLGANIRQRKYKYYINSDDNHELNSSYITLLNSYGPTIYFKIDPIESVSFAYNGSINKVNYNAEANWNLVELFEHPKSFLQSSYGYEYVNMINIVKRINPYLGIFLKSSFTIGRINKGTDKLFYKGGNTTVTQFNSANLSVLYFGIGFHINI